MRNDGIEGRVRRSRRRMIAYRLLGDLASSPQCWIRPAQGVLRMHGDFFKALEVTIFQLELDAAREYKLIAGIDLPTAGGDPGRYGGLDVERNHDLQQSFMDEVTSSE